MKFEIELNKEDAFRALLEVLDMSWIDDDGKFEIKSGKVLKDGEVFDDRADLFAALRNVENSIYPNLEFRGDAYITDYGNDDYESIDYGVQIGMLRSRVKKKMLTLDSKSESYKHLNDISERLKAIINCIYLYQAEIFD